MGEVVMLRRLHPHGVLAGLIVMAVIAVAVVASVATGGSDNRLPLNEVPAEGTTIATKVSVVAEGERYAVATYTNRLNEFCVGENMPGTGGGLLCQPPSEVLDKTPVEFSIGANQRPGSNDGYWSRAWMSGLKAPTVAAVSVRYSDCSTEMATLGDDGVFLHVIKPSDLRTGRWPMAVVATDNAGGTVFTDPIAFRGPPLPPAQANGQPQRNNMRPRGTCAAG